MKEMEVFVKAFGEGLRTLAQGVHAIADKLDSFVESSAGDRDFEPEPVTDDDFSSEAAEEVPEPTAFQKEPAVNATEVVHETVVSAANPITMEELCDRTGFDRKKLNNILYRLRKQGKIKNVSKGVYTKK